MPTKKFISPGAWFSISYPESWNEYEDSESTFLFYDPEQWSGNFRISAYRKDFGQPDAATYGVDSVRYELKNNPSAVLEKVGKLTCAYSKEMFQENNKYFVSHLWITGIDDIAFECTFTVAQGNDIQPAKEIIASLEVRKQGVKYPAEIIPARISEIALIDESYDTVASSVKKLLKKDFQGVEGDLTNIQRTIDGGDFKPKQKDIWQAIGITLCVILTNEIEGFEWRTLIDGNREAPVLQYKPNGKIIDPMRLVWSKIKAGEPCNVVEEYKNSIESLS